MSDTQKLFYSRKKVSGVTDEGDITPSSMLILQAADKLGVQWRVLPGTKIIELNYQGKIKYFRYQISTETTDVGFYSCLDKSVTSSLLEEKGIHVPRGFNLIKSDPRSYWDEVFSALQAPLVVKPTHGNQGQCITMGISDKETFYAAVEKAFAFLNDKDAGVIVEETCAGKEYRIVATRQKALAVMNRMPANVVGDGQSTLQQLIDQKNSDPRRSDNPNDYLVKIKVDEHVSQYLIDQQLTLDFVPAAGQRVFLRRNSNISTGGDSIDMTDLAHPSVLEIAVKAVNALPGLDFAGVDFISTDITQSQTPETYAIIEVNSSPGFSIHEFPFEGKPRNCAEEFLFIAFPELRK
jgi:cyanophycin synthetase